ncbi:MAG: hypothetical protein LUC41_03960 [Clostridiales bacterium]|nr:hypothetical protein [Clostridiales bacterium]
MGCAVLSSRKQYTLFSYDGLTLRFRTSYRLEHYTKLIEWDAGYIVVMAKYENIPEVEEYIDLIPVLKDLYMDENAFLRNIQEVRIQYD